MTEQVRVMRHALERRLNMKISGKHPVVTWLVERSADMISKYLVGQDGRTAYERWRGGPYEGDAVEFGEKVRYRYKKNMRSNKMEGRWGE